MTKHLLTLAAASTLLSASTLARATGYIATGTPFINDQYTNLFAVSPPDATLLFTPNFDFGPISGTTTVALGDFNNDNVPDMIVSCVLYDRIFIYDGKTGNSSFFHTDYPFGATLAVGDVNNDGTPDIIAANRDLATPLTITTYDGVTHNVLNSFSPFPGLVENPTDVYRTVIASADFNHDHHADILAVSPAGTPTNIRIFDGSTLAPIANFNPPQYSDFHFVAAESTPELASLSLLTLAAPLLLKRRR